MKLIRIFVSCTSEIKEEIELFNEAVKNINIVRKDVNIKTFSFKDIYPTNGAHAQEIIHKQIGGKYDIYLGIFWKKYGTPTNKFDSGVVDEYEKAKNDGKKIMFYFNIQSPNTLNDFGEDIIKINTFKKKLASENILYHEYNGIDGFKSQILTHLSQQVNEIYNSAEYDEKEVFDLDEAIEENNLYEIDPEFTNKLDFDDFIEDFENVIFTMTDILKRTTSIQKEFIQKIDIKYEKIQFYINSVDKFKIKKIYLSIAYETKLFAENLDINLKGLDDNIDQLITEMNNSFLLFPEHKLSKTEKKEILQIGVIFSELIKNYDEVATEVSNLRQTLKLSSKLSHYLRKQNRIVEKKLNDLEDHLANYYVILKEYELVYINKISAFV